MARSKTGLRERRVATGARRGMSSSRLRSAARALLGALAAAVVPAAAFAEAPLDPPRQYWTRGDASMTVRGAQCCGDTRFSGRFEAMYQIDSAGQATLPVLRLELDDIDVTVGDGFLGLFSGRVPLRCAGASSSEPAHGSFDGRTTLRFGAGTLRLTGLFSDERLSDGTCADRTTVFEAANSVGVEFAHDPAVNRFGMGGVLHLSSGGDGYDLTVHLEGGFANRPPQAQAGVITPDLPQGGCPVFWRNQEWLAEANDPAGLLGAPVSTSWDPDEAWRHGDIFHERWFRSRDGVGREFLGEGLRLPATAFEWGPVHRLELLAVDRNGAASAAACTFRVVDTHPPLVTPPPPETLGCSQPGGASPSTSAGLRAYLGTATAADSVDPAPTPLPSQVSGADVTDTMLFPVGWTTPVDFRFKDFAGNVGSTSSTVSVVDMVPPSLGLTLTPSALPANHKFYWITASLAATDDCGGPVTLRLVSIASNAPAYDASDILDASYGADDRGFYLYERLAAPGVPRIYKVVYEGRDTAGNARTVTAKVVVG